MDCHPFFVFGKRRVGLLEMEEFARFVASQSILIGKLKRAPPPKGSQIVPVASALRGDKDIALAWRPRSSRDNRPEVFEETPHGDWPRLRGHPLFLSYINAGKLNGRLSAWMAAFLFRCPNTGLNVQGWSADEISADEADTYESVTCIACQQAHLVNPATGKVLSRDEG